MQGASATLVVVTTLLTGAWAGPASLNEVVTLSYERDDKSYVPMDIKVDREARTITYHMKDQGGFYADVNTFEDYASGYAVSRVASQDSCFLRQLTEDIETSVERLHGLRTQGLQHILGQVDVWAEPVENLDSLAGSRLAEFCGNSPAYKLVRPDNSIERKPMAQKDGTSISLAQYLKKGSITALDKPLQKNRVSVTFFLCFLFFFLPFCFSTTCTINTGSTFIFFLFG